MQMISDHPKGLNERWLEYPHIGVLLTDILHLKAAEVRFLWVRCPVWFTPRLRPKVERLDITVESH
jgi:hypothetical protein